MVIDCMNTLFEWLLALGAPSPSMPNVGPWLHFLWVVAIMAAIFFVLWFVWKKICGLIPEPARTVLWIIGLVALCLAFIVYVLIPLMGVF